jgi:L-methionine (R)-S-oxide reductase
MLDERLTEWLRGLLERHGAVAGTVHLIDRDFLTIAAAVNIPPKVQELTAKIPMGKGMAGLAWQHDKPIQTCNLQDDTSGQVRPGAKAVDARAAVALPVHEQSGTIRAIVGLAWMDERVLPDATVAAIAGDAATLPE